MSDEESIGRPEDEQAQPGDDPIGDGPLGDDAVSADPEADPEAGSEPVAEEPEEELSDEAARALAAAQQAVAEVMGGGELADDDEPAIDSARATAAESQREVGRAIGATLPVEDDPMAIDLPSFDPAAPEAATAEMRLLGDVNVDVRIELGRTRMLVEDVLRLNEGAVVELEKLAGDPVDVYVNGRHVARGEVLVLNENFCVRVNEVIEPTPVHDKK